MRRSESTFGKSLPSIFIGGVLVSAVLALLAAATGQVLAANFYVGGNGASDRKPMQIDHNVFWNNHMNDVRLEQAKPPCHRVLNNTLVSTDVKYWFAFHSGASSRKGPEGSKKELPKSAE